MGIDKHLVLTLERSQHRQWAMLGGSVAMQTPVDAIHFVMGHDNKDYDDDMERVATAAEDDGYPYAHYFAKGLSDGLISQSASGVCQVWNFSRVLRHIALGTEICLVTWDDRLLTLPFPWIDTITSELQNREEEFYLWQLRIRVGDGYDLTPDNRRICECYPKLVNGGEVKEYLDLMERDWDIFSETLNEKWALDFQDFRKNHFNNSLPTPKKYVNRYLQKNRLGYDESMVISPKGAAWLLLQALNMEDLGDDEIESVYPYPKNFDYWDTVIHKRNTFDCWMIQELDKPVADAIADNKGIYCPKEIGYRYIHDWLPMGSDCDWANTDNAAVEEMRTLTTDLNFLEIL